MFFSYAMLNICNLDSFPTRAHNTSPVITNPPVAYICCNQPFNYNNGCTDLSDQDSLAYSMESPLGTSRGNILGYNAPLSKNVPMTPYCSGGGVSCAPNPTAAIPEGFYLNPQSGDLVFTPTNCSEVGVVVVQVNEYRKTASGTKLLMGIIRRDMQLIVENCAVNQPPRITGPTDTVICSGQSICFNVDAQDNGIDTLSMTWNRGVAGATFNVLNPSGTDKTAQFCWTPPANVVKDLPYTFTVRAEDNYCPRKATAIRSFTVRVSDMPPVRIAPVVYTDSCYQGAILSANGTVSGNYNFSWRMPGGTPSQMNGTNLMGPVVVRYNSSGTHPIYMEMNQAGVGGCVYRDTTSVNVVCNALPLSLLGFDAFFSEQGANQIQVNWKTTDEYDIDSFYVQISGDGEHYANAGAVAPRLTHGVHTYTTLIKGLETPVIYVRLVERTVSGATNIVSKTKVLDRRYGRELLVYPNPAVTGRQLSIDGLSKGAKEVLFMNDQNRIVQRFQVRVGPSGRASLDLPPLQQGIYYALVDGRVGKFVLTNQ